jgi:bifunctional DNA-binding transcriptional regulator/antitoxin component of YhaV-PrlF toxin-antitoxin module
LPGEAISLLAAAFIKFANRPRHLTGNFRTDILVISKSIRPGDLVMDTLTVQLSQRGTLVLPKSLRETYGLRAGDTFTLLDLGGVFVLSPRRSEIDALANGITGKLTEKSETLASMLRVLREERER